MSHARVVLRYFPRDEALRDRLPHLATLARAVRERPGLARAWGTRPARFTGRSDEDKVIAHLRTVDLSSVGL